MATTPEGTTLSSFLKEASKGGRIPSSVLQQYKGLSPDAEEVASVTWGLISTETPSHLIDQHVEWLIGVVAGADQESYTNQSCCFIFDLFAVDGYSSALSAMPGGANLLEAKVMTQSYSRTSTCARLNRGCVAVTAQLNKPTGSGRWLVRGQHRSRHPSRDRWTFTIVDID